MDQTPTPWRVFDAPAPPKDGDRPAKGSAPAATLGEAQARSNPRVALLGLAGALVVGVLAVILALGGTGGAIVDGPGTIAAEGSDGPAASGELVVDVSGAVARPGVYHLPVGSRVGDAIAAAGGFSPRVDAEQAGAALNLAATLSDGAQIRVPSRDDAAPTAGVGGGGGGSGGSSGAGGGGSSGTVVNLNTATEAELEALPGIGPVTAGKIIDSRTKTPFKTVDDLRDRGIVGQKTFDKIRAQLTVG